MQADPIPRDTLWEALGWQPTPEQQAGFERLQEQLRLWNSRLNLTRLVEGDDYWVAQVFDSLWPLRTLLHREGSQAPRIIDVGTGGGFPGLAVALAIPEAQLTLVDSVGRKLEAVGAMATALGLERRIELRCERIERTGHATSCRGRYDWALARAVARAPVVAEYLVPLLRDGGQALLYRGQWSGEDDQELRRALRSLRAELAGLERLELPADRGVRHALRIRPIGACPRIYPRAVGVPARHPLGGLPGSSAATQASSP